MKHVYTLRNVIDTTVKVRLTDQYVAIDISAEDAAALSAPNTTLKDRIIKMCELHKWRDDFLSRIMNANMSGISDEERLDIYKAQAAYHQKILNEEAEALKMACEVVSDVAPEKKEKKAKV